MSHPFEEQLGKIRETLLLMSSLADRNLSHAIRALIERDDRMAELAEAEDSEIDELEVTIDNMVITYMATHGPMAFDSRLMLTASKLCGNLERIGDEATTIARRARQLNQEPELILLPEISAMAKIAQQMLNDAITVFVDGRYELAQEIVARDKEVDRLNRQVAAQLIQLMTEKSENVVRAVHWMTISKAIERAADHAQNIAEEVFYLYRGKDIRHDHGQRKSA
jgi:phosphate transport system protein